MTCGQGWEPDVNQVGEGVTNLFSVWKRRAEIELLQVLVMLRMSLTPRGFICMNRIPQLERIAITGHSARRDMDKVLTDSFRVFQ